MAKGAYKQKASATVDHLKAELLELRAKMSNATADVRLDLERRIHAIETRLKYH